MKLTKVDLIELYDCYMRENSFLRAARLAKKSDLGFDRIRQAAAVAWLWASMNLDKNDLRAIRKEFSMELVSEMFVVSRDVIGKCQLKQIVIEQ